MNLSKDLRSRLGNELRFIAKSMEESADPFEKMYFFSAGYGGIGRILNIEWDPELALLHLVLQSTYGQVNSRVTASASGGERPLRLPDNFFEMFTRTTSELADVILAERDDGLTNIMARFAQLGYVTTGNGFYLFTKGLIKLQADGSK